LSPILLIPVHITFEKLTLETEPMPLIMIYIKCPLESIDFLYQLRKHSFFVNTLTSNKIANLQTGLNHHTKYHAIEFAHASHISDNVVVHHMSLLGCPENYPSNKIKTDAFDCTDIPMPNVTSWLLTQHPVRTPLSCLKRQVLLGMKQ
jgi:hypothetical protein